MNLIEWDFYNEKTQIPPSGVTTKFRESNQWNRVEVLFFIDSIAYFLIIVIKRKNYFKILKLIAKNLLLNHSDLPTLTT